MRRYNRWVPAVRWRKHFFQLNKEELSLRATMDLMGPSRQALHVQSSSDDSWLLTTLNTPCRAHLDWNDPEMGKTGQWSRRWRGVGNFTGSGARQHSRGAAHGRQEQEQRLKKEHGCWINIQRSSC